MVFTVFRRLVTNPVLYVPEDKREALAKDIERQTGLDDVNMLIGRQANVAKFMRRLLVRRFESSVAAFKSSLAFMINSSRNVLDWIERTGKIPVWKKEVCPMWMISTKAPMTAWRR